MLKSLLRLTIPLREVFLGTGTQPTLVMQYPRWKFPSLRILVVHSGIYFTKFLVHTTYMHYTVLVFSTDNFTSISITSTGLWRNFLLTSPVTLLSRALHQFLFSTATCWGSAGFIQVLWSKEQDGMGMLQNRQSKMSLLRKLYKLYSYYVLLHFVMWQPTWTNLSWLFCRKEGIKALQKEQCSGCSLAFTTKWCCKRVISSMTTWKKNTHTHPL